MSIEAHLERATSLLGDERAAKVELLWHLDVIHEERGYRKAGASSLWSYCTKKLGLRESAAWRRIEAMKLLRRFPQAAALLLDGRLSMTTFVALGPALTEENVERLFSEASHMSTQAVEMIAARENAPVVPTITITEEPAKQVPLTAEDEKNRAGDVAAADARDRAALREVGGVDLSNGEAVSLTRGQALAIKTKAYALAKAVSADQVCIKMVTPRVWLELARYLEEVIGHRLPKKDLVELLFYCMKFVLRELQKRRGVDPAAPKFGAAPVTNRAERRAAERAFLRQRKRDRLSAEDRKFVWERDEHCCTWIDPVTGERCRSREDVEEDHIDAVANGGKATRKNSRLLCRLHNLEHARKLMGEEFVERKIQEAQRERAAKKQGVAEGPLPLAEVEDAEVTQS